MLTKPDSTHLTRTMATRKQDAVRSAWLRNLPDVPTIRQMSRLLTDLGIALKDQLLHGPLKLELVRYLDGLVACYEDGGFQRPHWDVQLGSMEIGDDRRFA